MMNLMFSEEIKRNYMQRRDSTNLAKRIVESEALLTVTDIL